MREEALERRHLGAPAPLPETARGGRNDWRRGCQALGGSGDGRRRLFAETDTLFQKTPFHVSFLHCSTPSPHQNQSLFCYSCSRFRRCCGSPMRPSKLVPGTITDSSSPPFAALLHGRDLIQDLAGAQGNSHSVAASTNRGKATQCGSSVAELVLRTSA
jgi:hypothetical protein